MHKIMHGVGDIDSSEWFDKLSGSAVTRARADPMNVKCKVSTLEIRRNFFSNRVINDWNAVPANIKTILIPGKFKVALRKWQDGGRGEPQPDHDAAR
jgi:predicted secreted protein